MMPVYRHVDSIPVYRNNMPYNQRYHPSVEGVPPHMRADPSRPPVFVEWPPANNFGCSVPFHTCCGHVNHPGYCGWGAACPYIPAAPQFHCYGPHHGFPPSYPVQNVPPPHYSMQLPKYEYDKRGSGDYNYHCCVCPEHRQNKNHVKVEEQEPDDEKEATSVVPFQLRNQPYPIFWIPPEYKKSNVKPKESDNSRREKSWHNVKPQDVQHTIPSEWEPRAQSGWLPLDPENFGYLMQDNGKRIKNHQNEDKKAQFPFPLIWMPYHRMQNEAEKKDPLDVNAAESEEEPADSGEKGEKPPTVQENSNNLDASDVKEKSVSHKSIPVKQIEEPMNKEHSEDFRKRGRDVTLKKEEDNDKASANTAKRQSLSPPKASKLPPVCLRVDPLPRKKNGKVTSRSPSPPGHKEQPQVTPAPSASASSELKDIHPDMQVQNIASNSEEVQAKTRGGKTIEVAERKSVNNNEELGGSETQGNDVMASDSQKESFGGLSMEEPRKDGDKSIINENVKSDAVGTAKSSDHEAKTQRKKLSDEAAAVLIQSAYRGFEVRKWGPLNKLKEMAKVGEQVTEVKNQIHDLESCSDLPRDNKQKLAVGERIMNLLMRLDTIQGLHPSVRDIRRSLARELVLLQEKLDSLMVKNFEDFSKAEQSENPVVDHSTIKGSEEGQHERVDEQSVCIPSKIGDDMCDTMEENAEPMLMNDEGMASENEARELHVASDTEFCVVELENEPSNAKRISAKPDMVDVEEVKFEPSEIDSTFQLSSEKSDPEMMNQNITEVTCSSDNEVPCKADEERDLADNYDNGEVEELIELPQGLTNEEPASTSLGKETEKAAVTCDDMMEPKVSLSSPAVIDDMNSLETAPEVNLLNELAVGAIDEQDGPKNYEKPEMQQHSVPSEADSQQTEAITKFEMHESEDPCTGDESEETTVLLNSQKEVPPLNSLEQELVEPSVGSLSAAKTTDSVKLGCVEENGIHSGVTFEGDVQPTVTNKEQLEVLGQDQETAQVLQEMWSGNHFEAPKGASDSNSTSESGSEQMQMKNDDVEVEQLTSDGETTTEMVIADQPNTAEEDSVASLPTSPVHDRTPVEEQKAAVEADKRLIEENQKLREMMEKLMEAGKEQLDVIANLTGRVKDLEKKLSRKKQIRSRRHKVAASPRTCARQSTNKFSN